ncbi:DUF4231 domain-containing protein [Nonomuraea basaltis]|uniref:DUF4231 domain-containing protein n=1 Tax=Nonomuraea basaltis TaxID=2495887 RepID=UPI00110C6641|nr:DUF4231 domain-containing protein [Nonomuraea basaltis]TMR96125.1 DUF4231 domain-containing protein [Nonomuraea basaltis]
MAEQSEEMTPAVYALTLADESYAWYRRAAGKARRFYRLSESLQLVLSAAVPVSAVLTPGDAKAPAILGGLIVIVTGLRSVFHWHDDYLRFSAAREAVEAERRRHRTGGKPFDDPATRDQLLVDAITRIERQEMDNWLQLVAQRSEAKDAK